MSGQPVQRRSAHGAQARQVAQRPAAVAAPAAPPAVDGRPLLALADQMISKADALHGLLQDNHGNHSHLRRVATFRGKSMLEAMVQHKMRLGDAVATDKEAARAMCEALLNAANLPRAPRIFVPVQKVVEEAPEDAAKPPAAAAATAAEGAGADAGKPAKAKKKSAGKAKMVNDQYVFEVAPLAPVEGPDGSPVLPFDPDARYAWVYEGSTTGAKVKFGILVAIILSLCMWPLWPVFMRVVVWYISVTVLLLILGVTAIQLTLFGLLWTVGYEFWILPNLWADVPVWDLLNPVVTFEKAAKGQALWRLVALAAVVGAGYYVYTQAPDASEFLAQQQQFVGDLYAGKLLGDGSDAAAAASGSGGRKGVEYSFKQRRGPHIPDIDEIERMFAETAGGDAPAAGEEGAAAGAGAAGAAAGEGGAAAAGGEGGAEEGTPDMDALLADHHEGEDKEDAE